MKRLSFVFLISYLAILAFGVERAIPAVSANRPDARLDAIASSIAGHPVNVWCEDNNAEWKGGFTWGYTYGPQWDSHLPVEWRGRVWVHPWICEWLHTTIDAKTPEQREALALNAVATAIHTLVHESVHQRGGLFSDCWIIPNDQACEGRTDCEALALDEKIAVDHFGFGYDRLVGWTYKTVTKIVKRKGKRIRVKRQVKVYNITYAPSEALTQVLAYTRWYHEGLPDVYQGDC